MPYTADKPTIGESPDDLRARIPGWGVDLDPRDRPSVPRLQHPAPAPGVHWDFPERQAELRSRERSVEHAFLTPVFGTTLPPKALSGLLRRLSYRRFSEARAAHWLILLLADRVDVVESRVHALVRLRPDLPLIETGLRSELTHHGIRSRWRRKRADVRHQALDPLIVASPWIIAAALALASRNGR